MTSSIKKQSDAYSFWSDKVDIDELARQQGVKPVTNVDDLYADFWPEEEDIEGFLAALKEWRSDTGTGTLL